MVAPANRRASLAREASLRRSFSAIHHSTLRASLKESDSDDSDGSDTDRLDGRSAIQGDTCPRYDRRGSLVSAASGASPKSGPAPSPNSPVEELSALIFPGDESPQVLPFPKDESTHQSQQQRPAEKILRRQPRNTPASADVAQEMLKNLTCEGRQLSAEDLPGMTKDKESKKSIRQKRRVSTNRGHFSSTTTINVDTKELSEIVEEKHKRRERRHSAKDKESKESIKPNRRVSVDDGQKRRNSVNDGHISSITTTDGDIKEVSEIVEEKHRRRERRHSAKDKESKESIKPNRRVSVDDGQKRRNSVMTTDGDIKEVSEIVEEKHRGQFPELEGYCLGEKIRSPSHMIIEPTPEQATQAVGTLNKNDYAFIKRSDGSYTYAILVNRSRVTGRDNVMEDAMIYAMDETGCTKMIRKRHWSELVRLVSMK